MTNHSDRGDAHKSHSSVKLTGRLLLQRANQVDMRVPMHLKRPLLRALGAAS